MSANHKLTTILAGRTVATVDHDVATAHLRLADGATLTVKLGAGDFPAAPALGRVKAVRQQSTTLNIDYDSAATLTLQTAEPTASVMLRAKDGTLEYAD